MQCPKNSSPSSDAMRFQQDTPKKYIAEAIDVDKSTICRELNAIVFGEARMNHIMHMPTLSVDTEKNGK